MKYKLKTKMSKCPYFAYRSRQCSHKGLEPRKYSKKRYCGFKHPNDCPLYNEWEELKKCCDRLNMASKDYSSNGGEDE